MLRDPLGGHSAGEWISLKWKKFLKPKIVDEKDDVWQALWRSSLAELFGTAIFVFFGTGAAVATFNVAGANNVPIGIDTAGVLMIAMAFGFGLAVVIYAVGEISGGHINPAVTWATLMTGRLSVVRAFIYWISQLVGAICGSAILKSIIPPDHRDGLGCNDVNSGFNMGIGRAFGAELVYTFVFIFVVFATAVSPFVGKIAPLSGGGSDYGPGKLTPLAVGLCIFVLHTVSIPWTGAGFNPARSFGPAVVMGSCWDRHWIYWVAPFCGSTLAATIATLIFLAHPNSIKTVLLISRGEAKYQSQVAPNIEASGTAAPSSSNTTA